MAQVPQKWQRFGTSIFTQMTVRANAAGAVNLAQGFPDFDGPEIVKEAAIAAIRGSFNQYAPAPGLPQLRQLLVKRQEAKLGQSRPYDWDTEVTVFSGATEALFCAMQAMLSPGDEVIAFEPYYDSYPASAFAAGARVVGVPLKAPHFLFNPKDLGAKVTPRTKAILVNSPHNPSGRVFSQAELEAVAECAKRHDLWVITDEVYEELVYAPARHLSIASLPGMRERTLIVSSTSKTFSFTGWKIGYAFAPAVLMSQLRAVHQFTVFCSATPLQMGMTAALQLPESYYISLRAEYLSRRDKLMEVLTRHGFQATAPEGTYFVLANYSRHSQQVDTDFALSLTDDGKVATIPISGFYSDPEAAAQSSRLVRFAFCKGIDTLARADQQLSKWRANSGSTLA